MIMSGKIRFSEFKKVLQDTRTNWPRALGMELRPHEVAMRHEGSEIRAIPACGNSIARNRGKIAVDEIDVGAIVNSL